jgi:GNAT superfamily N-acetyltransferase
MTTTKVPGTTRLAPLPGEETLIGSWAALAVLSPGAYLSHTRSSVAAVFPSCAPLNNALLLERPTPTVAAVAASELRALFERDSVTAWAMWVPSSATSRADEDEVRAVTGMVRDTTTFVMTLEIPDRLPSSTGAVRTTVDVAGAAGDQPYPAGELPAAGGVDGLEGWVMIQGEVAIAGAWTFRNGADVGVYALGTAPAWRRRGIGTALMLHVLADARRHGARTASLQSTAMGEPLYSGLGFRAVGRYEEWIPCTS